ncbi:MAG TPA: LLM class flavin-dependent oxidoreductase [Nitrososphaerales archaeon]|nr:LLM class flavin-dependent oxidoreductase [Nitrososphaerales archaeon]
MLEPQEGMSVEEIVGWASYAERSGYGYIFRSDHLIPTSGTKGLASPECWVTLGAIAAKTDRIRFGPMVSPIGFRNPAILANMACTLFAYSKGRAILSIGAGWYQAEYEAHGLDFPDLIRRKEEFHEALQIIGPLVEGKHVAFKGKYYSADVECYPKPVPKIHLIVGGRDSQIMKWTGESADELNMFSPTLKTVEKARRILGEKSNLVLSQMGPFFIGETQDDLNKRVQRFLKEGGLEGSVQDQIVDFRKRGIICGTPEDFVYQIKEKKDAGVNKFYFQLADPTDRDAADILTRTLRRL